MTEMSHPVGPRYQILLSNLKEKHDTSTEIIENTNYCY